MRLLLIQPRLPESFWSFRWAFREIARDKASPISPLGLATLAALTPSHWSIRIIDENVDPIDWNDPADIVGVTGMAVQYSRQVEIARRFRELNRHVVVGGPFASLCPEEYRQVADTIVVGEAERTWPRFCADFEAGAPGTEYFETGTVDLEAVPVPRHDLLPLHRYQSVAIQFSRGCPFRCEFCDIIVVFGRKPRTRPLARLEAELDLLRGLGVRNLFFIDDNFIGHLPRCRELLEFLIDYQHRHRYGFTFGAETSANLASHPDLMRQLRRAGFQWVFVGLETPSRESLLETRKEQNTRMDPREVPRAILAHGIDVYASFVVGFDADDTGIFDRQFEFIQETGIIVASVGLLLALPRTPLHERLDQEGRLRPFEEAGHRLWNNLLGTNIVPLRMTQEELITGLRSLMVRLADDASIAERILNKVLALGGLPASYHHTWRQTLWYLKRFLERGLLPGRLPRAGLFLGTLWSIRRQPRLLPYLVANWVQGLAIQAFIKEHLRLLDEIRPINLESSTEPPAIENVLCSINLLP